MGSTATAALTVTGAVIAGSLQNYGTTSLIGATTVGTLAGSGIRMVVANATGVLGTQAIPAGGDNLGNHTATQAINLNNNWVSNDGTAKGLRIDNNGSLGVMLAAPYGVLDVGKRVTSYTGSYSANNGQHFANFGDLCSGSCQNAFDGSLGTFAISYLGFLNVGRFYSGGAVIRRANITINPISGYGHTSISGQLRVMAAMNETDVFTTIVNFTPFTGFGTHTLTFNNLIGYRFYKIEVSNVSTNLATVDNPWAQEASFFTETSNTTYNSGGFLVTENGTVGINTNAPTSTLDVNGNVRIRTGATANSVLIGNANGDASWSNTLPGFKISTTNPGSGTSDWIALNAGGSAGSRLVGGLLNGTPTIGGHNNILSGWTDLAISPGGGNVGIGTSTPSQKLTVNGSADITGSLGIGTNNPLEKLHIIGNAYLTGNIGASGAINCTGNLSTGGTLTVAGQVSFCGGAYTCSDNRYKKDIAPLSQSLQNVLSLNGYTYNWRREEFPNKQFTADKQIGFMAQEIEKMYPEIVYTDPATGYKSVDYSKITPVLVEAIKEQQEQIEQQNARLDAQQQLLNKLIKRLDALEKKKGNKVQP
jgi:Chaperone of endosialidase